MTISVGGAARVSYAGNGVTVAFTTPQFLANADIVATLVVDATGVETLQVLTTNYTLTGAGAASGTLTMLVAPPTGTTLVIYTDPEISQNVDLVNGDPLDVNTEIETPFDKLTLLYRRARNLVARSLRLPEGDVGFVDADTYLPAKVDRVSKYLAFDADGKPVATAGTTDATPHTATGVLIAASTSAANARSIIGAAGSGAATASGLTQSTAKLLGRTTAGTGAIEEIGVGADMALSAGTLSVVAASDTVAGKIERATVAEAAAGVDTDRAVTPAGLAGAGAITRGWVLLDNQTITGVASVSVTSKITSTYDDYMWLGENIIIANDNDTMTFQVSKDNNAANEVSNYWIGNPNAAMTGPSASVQKSGLNNSATLPMSFTMQFFNPLSIAVAKQWNWVGRTPVTGTGVVNTFNHDCMWNETGASKFVNAWKLSVSTTMSGTFKLYGIRKT